MKAAFPALFAGIAGCAFLQIVSQADAATYTEKVLYSFCSKTNCKDGEGLFDSLTYVNGTLYGTASVGGRTGCSVDGCGTVFSLKLNTGAEKTRYSFCSQPDCADGASPNGVIDVNGTFYGTTFLGGTGFQGQQDGTVFALDPGTGVEMVLYSFCQQQNCPDGSYATSLISVNGMLYGTTETGGTGVYGTAFSLDPNTGTEKVLYSFCQHPNCTDGAGPYFAMIDLNGTLYGTTGGGGESRSCSNNGCGTVFSLDPNTGTEAVLHSFCSQPACSDGSFPEGSLVADNGVLYGTTRQGGSANCQHGCGIIFSINLTTSAETLLYSFQGGADGAGPFASMVEVNGVLYGTTQAGGGTGCNGTGCGTVFSINPNTGAEKILYSFCSQPNCADGANPSAGLTVVKGKFYGTTDAGGANGAGAIFMLKKNVAR